jgi:hypothetical protein
MGDMNEMKMKRTKLNNTDVRFFIVSYLVSVRSVQYGQ